MTFDEWYAAQTGHKDRELAKAAWNASRAARDEAVKQAKETMAAKHMLFHRAHWERIIRALLPEEGRSEV
jgi:hypothetical protein